MAAVRLPRHLPRRAGAFQRLGHRAGEQSQIVAQAVRQRLAAAADVGGEIAERLLDARQLGFELGIGGGLAGGETFGQPRESPELGGGDVADGMERLAPGLGLRMQRGEMVPELRQHLLAALAQTPVFGGMGLHALEMVGELLDQRGQIRAPARGSFLAGRAGTGHEAGVGAQPVLEAAQERPLGLARLQIEKAEHERPAETEERGGEGHRHAAQRPFQPGLQALEQEADIAGLHRQSRDRLADRRQHRQQPPEGPEQAEEDEQAGEIAADLAPLVQPRFDALDQRPLGRGRDRHRPAPGGMVGDELGHRRK